MKTLLIDNYDSFTYNLFHSLAMVSGEKPVVIRNDAASWAEIQRMNFDNVVISPGPGTPLQASDLGVSRDAVLQSEVPVLGVCLGHQAIAHVCGAQIVHASEPVHGRVYPVEHSGHALFASIPLVFNVVRYHSLRVAEPLPAQLEKIGWLSTGDVMALAVKDRPMWGVQFHPESICAEYGAQLLRNFYALTERYQYNTGRRAPQRVFAARAAPVRMPAPVAAEVLQAETRVLDFEVQAEAAFVSLYADSPYAYWLDSSMQDAGLARFSFLGDASGPCAQRIFYRVAGQQLEVVRQGDVQLVQQEVFGYLQAQLRQLQFAGEAPPLPFAGGFVGYFGYELKQACGADAAHVAELPDAAFIFSDRYVAIDHVEKKTWLVALTRAGDGDSTRTAKAWFESIAGLLRDLPVPPPPLHGHSAQPLVCRLESGRAVYCASIVEAQEKIRQGESYEVCLTNRLRVEVDADPLALYRVLRRMNPAPYAAFLRLGDFSVVSASPERFLSIDAARRVVSKPVKGTMRRGRDAAEDARLAEVLRVSEKNRSENLMIVDLVRNDLGRVSEIGSVCVKKLMQVESFSTVHQLVSTVESQLAEGYDVVDCVRAVFPGGSMTGAPKIRTLKILDGLEVSARGIYSGALGYLSLTGEADLSIVIRTMVVQQGKVTIGTGGAIVALSDADEEFDEILLKVDVLLQALALHVCGRTDGYEFVF